MSRVKDWVPTDSPEFEAAVNLLADHWQKARGVCDYEAKPPVWEYPEIEPIRGETREYLTRNKFSHFTFGKASVGACDTCYWEYPALVFVSVDGRKNDSIFGGGFHDISTEQVSLQELYRYMAEAGVSYG